MKMKKSLDLQIYPQIGKTMKTLYWIPNIIVIFVIFDIYLIFI